MLLSLNDRVRKELAPFVTNEWTKKMLEIPTEEMHKEFSKSVKELEARKISPETALAYQTVAPLLIDREGIAKFLGKHPELMNALPIIGTVDEAVQIAKMDFRLNPVQQGNLARLLTQKLKEIAKYEEEQRNKKTQPDKKT